MAFLLGTCFSSVVKIRPAPLLLEEREKRNSPDGKLDKNGSPLKFSKDLESDWIVKNDMPHYGLKEHASVDVHSGFYVSYDADTRV